MSFATKVRSYAISFVLLAAFSASALAQIPNAGFETWTSGIPNSWITDNAPGVDTLIYRTTDVHSGTYAVEGVASSVFGVVVPPTLAALFTWTTRPTTFSGYYKFSPVGGDSLFIAAAVESNGSAIGAAVFRTNSPVSSYTQFSVPITYFNSGAPDSGGIDVAIYQATGSSVVHAGSTFKLDDLTFSGATDVAISSGQIPQMFSLHQNYPNPFNPSTVIGYDLPLTGFVSLKVYDLLGRERATLVNGEQSMGYHEVTFDASSLASGTYFYRLQAGSFTATKKLMLLK